MKKQLLKSALIALAGVGLMSGSALATLMVTITDGTNTQIFTDNDGNDNDNTVGVIDLDNFNFYGWTIQGTSSSSTGSVVNSNPLFLQLDSYEIFTNSASTSLQLTVEDTFTTDSSTLGYASWVTGMSESTMTTNSATLLTTVGSTPSDLLTILKPSNPSTAQSVTDEFSTSLMTGSFTVKSVVSVEGAGRYNFTASTNSNLVPEPATMLLFGTGLLGLASTARRRKN